MKGASILVATDIVADAELVKNLLKNEFENIYISTTPDKAVVDFEGQKPDVLILAFNTLEKSERYYLGLYRLSTLIHTVAHRTIILCNKDEIQRVYEQCRKEYFDDYVLFWPMTYDMRRLPMAIAHALRDLEHTKSGAPAAELTRQLRRIVELEELLEQLLDQGGLHSETASRSLERAEADIETAIDNISKKFIEGDFGDALEVRNPARVQQEFDKLRTKEVGQHFGALREVVEPIGEWVGNMKQQLAPHLESMCALKTLAGSFRPVLLVVDDDELERKLVGEILSANPYDLVFATSGVEALGLLRKNRPDLILMDMNMPEINGLETLRRLKAAPLFADIPVMMITGQSEKSVVVKCLKAGAVDFVLKPFNREVFLKKVTNFLERY
jgi:CheY-like chemotaxis protein